ncbi:uncharacterized protein HKW66_Vig0116760 [Vigna angularis]|nr:uncharacterized protein HKW66_Vig0116760 [Vigna angularis]BAU02012.1 hypothetical protein VIGAN_11141300 [Vigna angularis var. angularis]
MEEALKANAKLSLKLKDSTEAHSNCLQTNEDTDAQLVDSKVAEKYLGEANYQLQRQVNDLLLDHKRNKNIIEDLTKKNTNLVEQNTILAIDLEDIVQVVIEQYEVGFKKALAQAAHFYNIPLDEGNFDVMKDFYHGKLMFLFEMTSKVILGRTLILEITPLGRSRYT